MNRQCVFEPQNAATKPETRDFPDSMLLDAAAAAAFPLDSPLDGLVLAMASVRGPDA